MEILSVEEHVFMYWLLVILLATILLGCLGGVLEFILSKNKGINDNKSSEIILPIIIGIVVFVSLINTLNNGPVKTYKAKIIDFNEVYNNGYEIVDREGQIYILKKGD